MPQVFPRAVWLDGTVQCAGCGGWFASASTPPSATCPACEWVIGLLTDREAEAAGVCPWTPAPVQDAYARAATELRARTDAWETCVFSPALALPLLDRMRREVNAAQARFDTARAAHDAHWRPLNDRIRANLRRATTRAA